MKCSRCQGLMIRDHFLDFDGTLGHMWTSGHRCMNCGNVHDPVIEQHRLGNGQHVLTQHQREHSQKQVERLTDTPPAVLRAA